MTELSAKRISSISVSKLFGVYDHHIPLNTDERITIIHGPNGVGKTALLRLTNALLQWGILALFNTPFERFDVAFTDSTVLRATKSKKSSKTESLRIEYIEASHSTLVFSTENPAKDFERALRRLTNDLPFLHQISPDTWIDMRTDTKLDANQVLNNFSNLGLDIPDLFDGPNKKIGKSFSINLQVHFIEAQRLISFSSKLREARFRGEDDRKPSMFETVERYSTELLTALRTVQSKFAAVTQKLEQSFPIRLLEQRGGVNADELEAIQKKVSADRQKLISLGLIAETTDRNK